MNDTRSRLIKWTALLGSGLIAVQIATILFRGEAFCLNQGCKIVENLTLAPPIYFNLAGLLYFIAVFTAARRSGRRYEGVFDLLDLLLLAGLAGEGVLLGYQLFVAQTICAYCLLVLSVVVLLNIIRGKNQLLIGLPVFLSVLAVFAALNFGASRIMIQSQSLAAGTFAAKSPDYPTEQLYLFFSSDCPHCQNVLDAIQDDNSCEINFNPIDRIESLALTGLDYFPDYSPAINRLLLALLDIKNIPVLLTGMENGPTLLKGERAIVDYINRICLAKESDPYTGTSGYDEPFTGFSRDDAADGECEIEVACPDDLPAQPPAP
ncbi:MAG: hypothetical protein RQ753_00195 [Desulfurivibrionaceae bacterium]|nr:hypothetical protein [Desulfobulbales bacterium]MDT8334094.1 hypothetical protein [Desulfurivibrionaceae bacterium]